VLRPRQERLLLTGPRLWGAVLGLAFDQLVAWGVLYYAYAILSAPIAHDLGVSRLVVAGAFSVCLLVAGWVGRAIGPILDARGTRGAMRLGAFVAPIALAAIALAGAPVGLVAGFVLLGVAQALALYEPAFRTVVHWCADERTRSRALLLVTIVGGFASTVFLPLTTWLVESLGWRGSTLALAAVLAAVLVPARLLLPLPTRRAGRREVRSAPALPSERMLALGLILHALATTGVFLFLTWHLVEQGDSLAAAAGIAGLAGASQVPGRILAAPLRRLAGARGFLSWLLLVQAIALLVVAIANGAGAIAGVVVLGAASGVMTLERATVVVEWYGRDAFGTHHGRLAAATSTARAVSPFLVEAGHRVTSYAAVFAVLAVVLALGAWSFVSATRLRQLEASTSALGASIQ
jgi:MFS family permease